ncbi:MAG: hypothetical protein M3N30_10745 [Bacteroidota bacterium]|nr:hypothetical protein [Bacteroidota bacterium]
MENEYLWGVWFYRVTEWVTAFNEKNQFVQDYEHVRDFADSDWPAQRNAAIEYFQDRGAKLPERILYPNQSPEQHREYPGIPYSTYSANISFVFWKSEDDFDEYIIAGEDDSENEEGQIKEKSVWEEHGLTAPEKPLRTS